jgi:hypothetical protein
VKRQARNRAFVAGCVIYLSAVTVAFVVGILFATKDSEGVSFLPTLLLTLPWFFVIAKLVEQPQWLFSTFIAFYDLPIFLFSAFLNIAVAGVIRRLLARNRTEKANSILDD